MNWVCRQAQKAVFVYDASQFVLGELWDKAESAHCPVKEYRSSKVEEESGWHHHDIPLVPRSSEAGFEPITLKDDLLLNYRVVGEFVKILESR